MVFIKKRILIFATFLCLAPLWAPYVREANGRRLFLTADSMVLLGSLMLIGYLFSHWLPQGIVTAVGKIGSWVKKYWVVLGAIGLGLTLGGYYLVNQKILHSFMNSGDEHSCLFLAECIRMGKWFVETHPLSEFFDVVHVGNRDGKWFSVYPLGWPLLMALGIQWNILDWMNPLITIAALFFIFKAGTKLFGFAASSLSLAFLVITPFFAFTSASYYSHSTCLLMIGIFSYAFLKWEEAETSKTRVIWAVILATAVGYGMITRYLTMAAFAAPFLVYRFWPILRRREKPRTDHYVIVGILAAFMLLIYYQNFMVTGKFYKAPNRYDKSWEKLGFSDDYSPLDGIIFLAARSFYLMDWTPPIFFIIYIVSLFKKRNLTVTQRLFRYAYFYPVIAFFFYFSWGGNQYGPRYYYEGFPFLLLMVGDTMHHWWQEGSPRFRKWIVAVSLMAMGASIYQFAKHGEYYDEVSSQRKALYDFAERSLDKPSVVYIRGFVGQRLVMSEDDAVRNKPSLDGKILYAHDMGEEKNLELQNYFPERDHYIGIFDRKAKVGTLEPMKAGTK